MTAELEVREVAAAVIAHKGKVLVQTRPEAGRYQGYWEFPGGGREPGESAQACAFREVEEEVGLGITVLRSLDVVDWSYPGVRVRIEFMLCTPQDAEPEVHAREGQELRWVDGDELGALQFLPASQAVVDSLRVQLTED